ncbi:solute carrier family 35 member G1-like [Centruroides vittatus]|uniref:solute carrier family 35 member G1-like n=1 Tax=Centruroides vittatus TaxID=120091 RepID=UPI00350FBB10
MKKTQSPISTIEHPNNNNRQSSSNSIIIKTPSNQHENVAQPKKKCHLYKGLLLASLSSVFFCLSSVIVKYMSELNPAQLSNSRFLGILIFTMPTLSWRREFPFGPKNLRPFLIVRGLLGASNLFLRFVAFRYLPLADASIIVFSVPVFVAIFAKIFLKEPCGIFQGITVSLTLLGVFLITKMPLVIAKGISYTNEQIWGIVAAITSTLFGAGVYIVLRKLKNLHHSVVMFNFGWVAVIETAIITSIFGFNIPKCGLNQGLIVLLGIFSFFGQSLMTQALQTENAAPVSIVRAAVDIILAFFWQVLFFHDIPDVFSITGTILVTFCIFMISIRKWKVSLPKDSNS